MEDPAEATSVHVLDHADPAGRRRASRPWLALLLLLAALGVSGLVLSRVPSEPPPTRPEALEAVERLRAAIDSGEESAVLAALAEGAILTWPAGPPWGGPLSGSVELVTDVDAARLLDHVAQLDAYLGFYRALNGRTKLVRCSIYSEPPAGAPWLSDVLIGCDFSIQSDLLTVLSGGNAVPFGQMRFRVRDDRVSSVLIETWQERFSPIEFLTWIREERPDTYTRVFDDRVTLPNYSAATAAELLTLASEFAAATE